MATRGEREQAWFRVPTNWCMDEHLVGVPEGAQHLFLKIIECCHQMGNGGVLTVAQVQAISGRVTRGRQHVDRLLSSGALRVVSPLSADPHSVDSALSVRSQSVVSWWLDRCQLVVIANAARWLLVVNQPTSIPAGRNTNRAPKETETEPRGGARVKKEREKEREEERTPSGSVRSSSAQAAPRVAGGAAQPAPKDLEPPGSAPGDGGGTMSRAEAIAFAKSEIARGRKKSPAPRETNFRFSKYDPDRPIEPIPRTLIFGEEPE